jgi:CPA2 family monovalent cation:H+ antiporter-2
VNSLDLYTRWVGQLGVQKHTDLATRLIRRWFWQMALNAVLVAAIFISAGYLERRRPDWLTHFGLGAEGIKAMLWLAAAIASLPLLIATFRKLQALGLLLAETRVNPATAGERTAAIRMIVAQVVPVAGAIVLGLFVLALSSTLLPGPEVFIIVLAIVALVAWVLWRSFIRIYSKAQAALQETFAQPPPPRPNHAPALPSLLSDADLATVAINPGSPVAGRLIRELELRTRTGASIVGIERAGARIINPGPDEELQSGDQVLLLGSVPQLNSAKSALSGRL